MILPLLSFLIGGVSLSFEIPQLKQLAATSFVYDGTSFATSPSMGTARSSVGSPGPAGTSTSAIAIGGYTSTNVTTTEEFTGETTAVNVKTLTQS